MQTSQNPPFGLFFEVTPHSGHLQHYFTHVERLAAELAAQKGLLSLQRYNAQHASDKNDGEALLSHQLWESEEAIAAWRANKAHRTAQIAGMKTHFKDYRIRIGPRLWRWQKDDAALPPVDQDKITTKMILSLHCTTPLALDTLPAAAHLDITRFTSVQNAPSEIVLIGLTDYTKNHFTAITEIMQACTNLPIDLSELFAIERDYGKLDRTAAPDHG